MAIDTPAKLAILGAGPIGLEAALYARFLGYDVVIFEQGRVCEHVQRLAHAGLLSPFAENSSPLGLGALTAQDENYQPPEATTLLTGRQWLERYLQPLADSDLLSDHLFTNTRVLGVGKEQVRKTDLEADLPEGDERGDWAFRILVRDVSAGGEGNERIEMVDGVLDCTGVASQPNFAGHGGLPAIGELGLRDKIVYHLPDVLEADRGLFEDRHTLLIGEGCDAAAAVVLLDELQQQSPGTRFTWITSHEHEPSGPIDLAKSSSSPARQRQAEEANRIARESQAWKWGTHLEGIRLEPNGKFSVTLSGQIAGEQSFDRVLALVGYRGETALFSELQIAVDPIHGGNDSKSISRGEANYYVLGSKTAGRNAEQFSFADGIAQIRQVFAIIGDRESLDLYAQRTELK
ncbi:hypothetical protein [Anatilimnocola floriformis]|uniref:hypothetical protein n=1 Tax=Anatilimnocola floriformis TaxID=2948575 RepID=UPI0020C54B2D|nr:hypothetical protein [Anatilimnocola floriformis]